MPSTENAHKEICMNVRHASGWHAAIVACLFSTGVFAQAGNDSIIGKWYVDDKTAIFDFYRTGNEYRARLIPLAKPDMVDTNNPVDSLKIRKLSGATLIYGLSYDTKKNRWNDGRVYDPENGKTYFCNCKLAFNGLQLLFRGYLSVSILGETRTWTRVTCCKTKE
jgi:uncharacterized protein (DUF2147 family)